jgi:hypothetical protein
MISKYKKAIQLFDRSQLLIKPLMERDHDLSIKETVKEPVRTTNPPGSPLNAVAEHIVRARREGKQVIMMMGAHVIRSGVQKYIIDLMERGFISCLSMNGAGIIHDFEFALIGATTESVAKYIQEGQFGLWKETGMINDIINSAYREDPSTGMGEAVGKAVGEGDYPYKEISLLAAGYGLGIPVTVHVGIGYDIIHEHPNCDGAATGATSYNDFLRFARNVEGLEGGVIMNFGSAVMAPEVFLKALSMARNAAHGKGETIRHFATLVCDLREILGDFGREPVKEDPQYYFRPWKTMLVRTVADGGKGYYVRGRHEETIPGLWTAINDIIKGGRSKEA